MIGLVMVFCLGFLLAGLALSISSKKDHPVSFFQRLKKEAKKYLVPSYWFVRGGGTCGDLALCSSL